MSIKNLEMLSSEFRFEVYKTNFIKWSPWKKIKIISDSILIIMSIVMWIYLWRVHEIFQTIINSVFFCSHQNQSLYITYTFPLLATKSWFDSFNSLLWFLIFWHTLWLITSHVRAYNDHALEYLCTCVFLTNEKEKNEIDRVQRSSKLN